MSDQTNMKTPVDTSQSHDWISTASGGRFFFDAINQSDICIEDIARALANLCRFVGHVSEFYSVAQHCVLVASVVPDEHKLAALLHDASEAYTGDMSRPLKRFFPDFRAMEKRIQSEIFRKFGVREPLPHCIKIADLRALLTERKLILPKACQQWFREWEIHEMDLEPICATIEPWPPHRAQREFLDCFKQFPEVGR